MKAPDKIREIKFHCGSFEEALEILKPLNLGEPRIEEVTDTYLKSGDVTKKVYEVGGEIFLFEVVKDEAGFAMASEPITEEEKENQIKEYGIDKVMRKKRTIWGINDIKVAIDEVEGLGGAFIEIQGEKREELLKILDKIGVDSTKLITQPYNKLQF